MEDLAFVGRSIGTPVSPSDFKFDSTSYKIFFICEVSLGVINGNKKIKLHYLIGEKKNGQLLATIDRNCNNNFFDDTVATINLSQAQNCDFKTLQDCMILDLRNFDTNLPHDFLIHVLPRACFKNLTMHSSHPFLDTANIAIESPFENVMYFKTGIHEYKIAIQNSFPKVNFANRNNVVVIISNAQNPKTEERYYLTDTLKIGQDYFCIPKLSVYGDTLVLKKIERKNLTGYKVGFFAYDFNGKYINNDKKVSLNTYNGKYLLMEFWGTWCVPCMELHDDLVALIESHSQLKYLGVSYDKDLDKVKTYINSNSALRDQIFVSAVKKQASLVTKYDVVNYPTFVLIDRRSKIIFRDFGIDGFHRLSKFILDNHIR